MRTMRWISIVAGLTLALLLAGCAVTLPSGDVVAIPIEEYVEEYVGRETEAGAAGSEVAVAEPEPKPEPILFSLLPLSDGEPLRARELFAQASPSVAHVSTPHGTGSAVLVDHGYLVSAAHVVWPYEGVRAVFPDGTEFEELPVAAWDLMLDLALLGPVDMEETEIEPLTFTDGTDLPIGSEVYFVGYPAEFEQYPQPSLARGLLSRTREWETTGLSMLQVDADISGGQSGGAMLSEQGELIGITNYRFTDSNSPMVTSSADVVPALTAMLAGEAQTLADRRPMAGEPAYAYEGVLEDQWSYDYYLLVAEAGDEVDLAVEGASDPYLTVGSIRGEFVDSSMPVAAKTSGIATTVWEYGPYIVEVTQNSSNRNPYALTSSHPLYAIEDPDDGRQVQFGDAYTGNIDNPADADVFTIHLRAGNKLVVQVESLAVDPIVAIDYESKAREDFVMDDDSGPTGIFGLNARAVFVASEEGDYTILVGDSENMSVGGYILTVSEGTWNDPITETGFSLDHYLTSHGLFSRYASANFPFTMLYPAEFGDASGPDCVDASACFAGDTEYFVISEASPGELSRSERDPDQMLKMLRAGMESTIGETMVLSRRTLTTMQGLDARMESMTAYEGTSYIASFVFFDEDIGVFVGMFITDLDADADVGVLEDSAEFMFSTLHVYDDERPADDAIFHLEKGMLQAAKGYYRPALADLKFALLLDEEMVEAYALRAAVYENTGDYDAALADLDAALAVEPDNVALLERQAFLHWYQGEIDQALSKLEQVRELRPDYQRPYRLSPLFRTSTGDYAAALAELAQYAEMAEDGLPASALNIRAYVHLKSGALEEALADYEEALAEDFQYPMTLLGAGVTYARLERMDEALPLLEYGMEQFEMFEYEVIDPLLADLLAMAQEILDVENAQ